MIHESVTFVIPDIPPSSNHAIEYRVVRRYVQHYPSKELKAWQELVKDTIPYTTMADSVFYQATYIFAFPIFYKNGNVRRADVCNLVKYAQDAIFAQLLDTSGKPIDDCRALYSPGRKVDCESRHTEVTISTMSQFE